MKKIIQHILQILYSADIKFNRTKEKFLFLCFKFRKLADDCYFLKCQICFYAVK